jgi:hypothetical protein
MMFEVILLLLAIPIGLLISWMASDELVIGRKWFNGLVVLGVVLAIGGWLFGFGAIGWSGGFIAIVSFVSYWKSFDIDWTKKKV